MKTEDRREALDLIKSVIKGEIRLSKAKLNCPTSCRAWFKQKFKKEMNRLTVEK